MQLRQEGGVGLTKGHVCAYETFCRHSKIAMRRNLIQIYSDWISNGLVAKSKQREISLKRANIGSSGESPIMDMQLNSGPDTVDMERLHSLSDLALDGILQDLRRR